MRGFKAFCVAARRLSFKEAADELCVTPSAVSHQIKVLEETLGVTLFERLEQRALELGAELETNDRYHFVYRDEDAANEDVRALREWVVATFASNEQISAVA